MDDNKCSNHKQYKGWSFSKEKKEKWFSDRDVDLQQHKEKKRKRLNNSC
jgi:hypothetical protein